MSAHMIDELIEELVQKLGDRPFYTLSELKATGFFWEHAGSQISA